jgi:hypothetical protein
MAISFSPGGQTHQRKRLVYLALVLVVLLLVFFSMARAGLFKKEKSQTPASQLPAAVEETGAIQIEFGDLLKKSNFESLKILPEVPALPENVGRENPFVPY